MSQSRSEEFNRSQKNLLRALRLTLWIVPITIGVIGVAFVLVENSRHVDDPGWPWLTILGLVILGFAGPFLSWLCLRWALNAVEAYLSTEEELAQRADELSTLNTLSASASRSLDPEKTITTILEQTMAAMDADAGMIFIQGNDQPGLRLEAHRGISVDMAQQEATLSPGHCLCGQSVSSRQVLFAADVGNDPRCTSDLCICEGFRSVACAPLEVKGQLVGLLQLASPNVDYFSVAQRDFLMAVATQASVSIENARLYDKVRLFNLELEQLISKRTSELETARWALAEKARQLQRLLSQSYRIQEDTQARIAHDMHDGVTQMIIGALYETQAARDALIDDPDRAVESLARAQQLLTEVDTEIRRVIYDLHPPVLDMLGLVVALKRFAANFTAAFDIECRVDVNGQPARLPKETEVSVYRIIQAALHNVATHSQASRVLVGFDFSSERVQVMVDDDGIGFEPQMVFNTPGDHLGLIGMKERADALGALLNVDSGIGDGTQIELRLPRPSASL